MRAGAFDYLVKPTNIAEVRIAVERAMSLQRLREALPAAHITLLTQEKLAERADLHPVYIGEVEDMADAILLNKPPRVSLADSRGNIAVILALIDSTKTGKPVHL